MLSVLPIEIFDIIMDFSGPREKYLIGKIFQLDRYFPKKLDTNIKLNFKPKIKTNSHFFLGAQQFSIINDNFRIFWLVDKYNMRHMTWCNYNNNFVENYYENSRGTLWTSATEISKKKDLSIRIFTGICIFILYLSII